MVGLYLSGLAITAFIFLFVALLWLAFIIIDYLTRRKRRE